MTLLPRSLFGRLLVMATLTTLAALAFAGFAIGHVLDRFVRHTLDEQVDAQAAILVKAVRPDGTIDRSRIVELPAFRSERGWAWRIMSPAERLGNGEPLAPLPPVAGKPRVAGPHPAGGGAHHDGPRPGGPNAEIRTVATRAGAVTVIASGPPQVAFAALREALVPVFVSLGFLGVCLAIASLVQLRLGLRPLARLQAAVSEVRTGKRRHVPEDQPAEVAPLAAELNALLDENEAGLVHARRHVANLAHGLKTPLAALAVRLAESGADADGALGAMVAQIDDRIRHHLARARAVAAGGGRRARADLGEVVGDLVRVLAGMHPDGGLRPVVEVAADAVAAIDPRDLEELLGNLLDNAWRHARASVRIRAVAREGRVAIVIDDDGPGLGADALEQALAPGQRLDERGEGFGFGLSIAQDLAELNGGALALGRSGDLGGLSVSIDLPRAGTMPPA